MGDEVAVAGVRPRRADARRNYDSLLQVATEAFTNEGVEVPLEELARRAGVGIGTLYRHFPSRDVLVETVYRAEVDRLAAAADELLDELPPGEALEAWMHRFVGYVATKRGMAAALKNVSASHPELVATSRDRTKAAATKLLGAASAAGDVRGDTDPQDLVRAISGICLASDQSDWQQQATRLVGLLMDGLRYGAERPS